MVQTILFFYLMGFTLTNYSQNAETKCSINESCKECCYKEYSFCTILPDAIGALAATHSSHEDIRNFLEDKLANSNFLGIKISGRPILDILNVNGIYYVDIKDKSNFRITLRDLCAKINTKCTLRCVA
ncbi:hypothetical protein [Legionella maceachernii]|nr:hypothetical protein [Legionella maceachernii]